MVLQACPDIVDYAKGGEISCWRDLISAAATVRSALGVSPDAWSQALEALGEHDASIVIAAIVDFGFKVRPKGIRRAFSVSIETRIDIQSQMKPKIGRSGKDRFTFKRWLPALNITVGRCFPSSCLQQFAQKLVSAFGLLPTRIAWIVDPDQSCRYCTVDRPVDQSQLNQKICRYSLI
jgi:hypothetical protein